MDIDYDQKPEPSQIRHPSRSSARIGLIWPKIKLRYHLIVALLLAFVTLLAYGNSFQAGFSLDNKFIILEDPRLREYSTENLKLIFTQDYWWPKAVSGLYRPLTTLSYLVNYAVLGNQDRPGGYHVVNLLLHVVNALLVYALALLLVGQITPSIFISALFALHPIGTESVTNIVGRADLFATGALLGGFLCYVRSTQTVNWKHWCWLVVSAAILFFGTLCKESTVAMIGVIVLYDFTYRIQSGDKQPFSRIISRMGEYFKTGYFIFIIPLVFLWLWRLSIYENLKPPEFPFVDNPLVEANFWTVRLTALKVIGNYLGLLVWPRVLSCDYSYNHIPLVTLPFSSWEDWKAMIVILVLVVALGWLIRQYSRNKAIFFFALFSLITFLPTSNLIKIIGSIMAERFLYTPLVGFTGCLVIVLFQFFNSIFNRHGFSRSSYGTQTVMYTFFGILAVGYGARTFVRNYDWKDDVTLWSQAVKACPNSFKTHKSLAYALYEADPSERAIDRIIAEAEKAVEITDKTSIVFLHLGVYYRAKGDFLASRNANGNLIATEEAKNYYQKSADTLMRAIPLDHAYRDDTRQKELERGRAPTEIVDVGNHEIYLNLGLTWLRLREPQKALDAYLYMLHLTPGNPDAYQSIASVFIAADQGEQSIIPLIQTMLLDNNRKEALQVLIEQLNQIDTEGCAIRNLQGKPVLNSDCAIVRQYLCSALYGLTQNFLKSNQQEIAQQTADNALEDYHCPAEIFYQLLQMSSKTTGKDS